MWCLVVVQDEGWAKLCSLTNNTPDLNQIAGTRVYISLLPAYTFILCTSCIEHNASTEIHRRHPEQSRQHVTCTDQRLSFQYTPDNLHNFVRSVWAFFHSVQLYHNANASDVDSFSTHSDGTKGHLQRKGEGNCQGKNADNGYKSTPVVESGLYKGIHPGTHLWTHTDIPWFWHQGWDGLWPVIWYNLSWSSHDLPLSTISADVATPQEQESTFSGVLASLPLIYEANVWQNPRSNEQLEVGSPQCLRGSCRSLLLADNLLAKV